jgi:Excalibur calcium-binding domain
MAKDLLILVLIGVVGWYGYTLFEGRIKQILGLAPPATVRMLPERFTCDGRIYCSQMTSCEEARFFLSYCPSTKLDSDGEGIPCEKRWCK